MGSSDRKVTAESIANFIDKVILDYSRVLHESKGKVKKLSSLPYPAQVIKSCLKVDAANSLADISYVDVLSACYASLADFVPDEAVPAGPTISSLIEAHFADEALDVESIMAEINDNESSVNKGLEMSFAMQQEKEALKADFTSYLRSIASLEGNGPTADAVQAVFAQIACIKDHLKGG